MTAIGVGVFARADRLRVRLVVHHRQAGDLRLLWLFVVDLLVDVPVHQLLLDLCAWLQGGRHDYHVVRHGDVQRS